MIWGELGPGIWNNIRDSASAESSRGSTKLGGRRGKNKTKAKQKKQTKNKQLPKGQRMEGEALLMAPRILLFIQGVKGGGQELRLFRPPGIALGNKGKAKAEWLHLLTGAGYCQEVKLPLLLQKKTYCEITELSQSQTVLSSSG